MTVANEFQITVNIIGICGKYFMKQVQILNSIGLVDQLNVPQKNIATCI